MDTQRELSQVVQQRQEAIEAFRKLVAKKMRMDLEDVRERDIIITPYDGAYGWAGVVITVNGSPPRGTFLVRNSGPLVIVGNTGTRTVTSDYADRLRPVTTVKNLLRSHGFPIGELPMATLHPLTLLGEQHR